MMTSLTTLRRFRFKNEDLHATKSVEVIGEPFFVIERADETIIYSKVSSEMLEFDSEENN